MNDPGLGPGTCAAPRTRADCAPGGQHRHFTPGTPSDRSSRSHDPKPLEMNTTHVRVCASPGERQHQHASLHCTPGGHGTPRCRCLAFRTEATGYKPAGYWFYVTKAEPWP